MDHKQQELARELFDYGKAKFPEIEFLSILPDSNDPHEVLLSVAGIDFEDDDRYMDFFEYISGKAVDILVDHGYEIRVDMVSNSSKSLESD